MVEKKYGGDLELEEDLKFQERTWKVERVAWWVMAFIGAAGLLGVLGPGVLCQGTAGGAESGFQVEYDRFVRNKAPNRLTLRLNPGIVSGSSVRIWISREYLEGVQVEPITPAPQTVESGAGRVNYTFRVGPDKSGGTFDIDIPLKIQYMGPVRVKMGVVEGPTVEFRQFAYP